MTGWVPFSHRYGISDVMEISRWCSHGGEVLEEEVWRFRHTSEITVWDEPDARFRCTCPGSSAKHRCRMRASQEDRMCDACREHCWAVDDAQRYHRLVGVYGPAS